MSFSAITGVFLKLPKLFLRICRSVLVRMALHCKASGLNGGFSTSSKVKEGPRGSNSRKWSRMLLLLWAVSGILALIWVFCDFNETSSSRREKITGAWTEETQVLRQKFNITNDEIETLASLFSTSDGVCVLGAQNVVFLFHIFFSASSTQLLLAWR